MKNIWRNLTDRSLLISLLILIVAPLIVAPQLVYASNDYLDGRYDTVLDPSPSAVTNHLFGLTMSETAVPVGSIRLVFCSNSPIIGDACTVPSGLDTSGMTLGAQTGDTGFSLSGLSAGNTIILTRSAALPSGAPSTYLLQSIINPDTEGSYYVRIETFTSTDATGLNIEQGGIAFAINGGLNLSAEVPPYLKFCTSVTIAGYDCSTATSYLIDLGEFSSADTTAASSEFIAATNAQYGYSVTVAGTTLTSGNNIIPAMDSNAGSAAGTGQFGINLRLNSQPVIGADVNGPGIKGYVLGNYNIPNSYRFLNGDVIAASTGATDNQKFTVSYVVNVDSSQPPGYYATTMTYICLANF